MQKKLAALLFLLLNISAVYSQDDSLSKVPTPDFPGEPMLLVESNYTLLAFPAEKSVNKQDRRGDAIMLIAELKNMKSEFRLTNAKNKVVVLHEASNVISMNPKDYYKVFKLELDEKKNQRTATVGATYITNRASEKHQLPQPVAVTFKKVRDNTYLIELNNLEQGEYAIITNTLDKFYTFGVD